MSTISAKVIKKPRAIRYCGRYQHNILIPNGQPHVRIYGSGFSGDPPYVLYLCVDCARRSPDPKIRAAIKQEGGQE